MAPGLLRWMRAGPLIAGGAVVAAVGAVLVAVAVRDAGHELWPVIVGAVLLEAGVGPVFGVGAGLIVSSAPPEGAGSATAVQDVGGSLASVFSLAVGGTIALLVYRATLAAQSVPGVTAADHERAVEGMGAALALVDELGGPSGQALKVAVQQSFAVATSSLYFGAAALLAAVAIVSWRGLRT